MKTQKSDKFNYEKTSRKKERDKIRNSWVWLWYHGLTKQKPGKVLIRKSITGRRYIIYPNGQVVRATKQLLSQVSSMNEAIKKRNK